MKKQPRIHFLNEDILTYHYYSQRPISDSEWVLFYYDTVEFDMNDLASMRGYTFGVTLGSWAIDSNPDMITTAMREKRLLIDEAPTDELNFTKLARGRIDIFPQQLDIGLYQIEKMVADSMISVEQAEKIKYKEVPYRKMCLYLLFSRAVEGNKEMVRIFDRAHGKYLASLTGTGS